MSSYSKGPYVPGLTKGTTATPTHDLKAIAMSAALTGVSTGVVSYLVPSLGGGAFTKPAVTTALAAGVVFYLMPLGSPLMRSAAIGGVMAVGAKLVAEKVPLSGMLSYGAIAAASAFIGTEVVMPALLGVERSVAGDMAKFTA